MSARMEHETSRIEQRGVIDTAVNTSRPTPCRSDILASRTAVDREIIHARIISRIAANARRKDGIIRRANQIDMLRESICNEEFTEIGHACFFPFF